MQEMPLLRVSDIEVRVNHLVNGGASALLLLYKSARTDMRVLDEVFGPMNWKRSHEIINGKTFCTISVWDEEKKEWISKQDVGVPSNQDAQKGEASDSFKRAGFNWGIGRELYDAPTIFVKLSSYEVSGGKLKSSVVFIVADAEYDKASRSFTKLVIVDRNGQVRWQLGNTNAVKPHSPAKSKAPTAEPAQTSLPSNHQLAAEMWNQLKASGVDPEAFARYCCKTTFHQIPADRLQNLADNFDATVDWFKKKAV